MSIQSVRGVTNPQLNYEWEIEILGSVASGNLPILKERAQSAQIPEKSVEEIIINHKANQVRHAGRDSSPHTQTTVFWDDEDNSVREFFDNWFESGILNTDTGGGASRDVYAAQMIIRRYAKDSQTVTEEWVITNVWPQTVGQGDLTYEGSETSTVEVTFSFDVCRRA